MIKKRFGQEFERLRDPRPGELGKARKYITTWRYDFFFDAVKDGVIERFAHAWRETTPKNAEKKLRADYRKRSQEISKIYCVDVIPKSEVNPG